MPAQSRCAGPSSGAEKLHITPQRSKVCPYQSPHGAFMIGMPSEPPPSISAALSSRARSISDRVHSSEYAVSRSG